MNEEIWVKVAAGGIMGKIHIMADEDEESDEEDAFKFKKPLELFEEKQVVRICAPMVRYSK